MKKFIITMLLTGLILFAGCDLLEPGPGKHLLEDVSSVTKIIDTSTTEINKSTQEIDKNVVDIKQNALIASLQTKGTPTEPIMAEIDKSADRIAVESQKLQTTSSNLSNAGIKLQISGRTIDEYVDRATDAEKANEKLIKENAELNENVKSGLNRMLKWIVGGCLIGAGLCAAMAIFFGNIKGGLFGAATCIIIMTLAIAVGQYMMYIAIAGILAIVATLGVLGYQLFIQRRAISDNVWTQEIIKKKLPLALKEKIYGGLNDSGHAGFIQSATTQKIVKSIKSKLPRGWKVIKDEDKTSS